jgi:hypothetical protein
VPGAIREDRVKHASLGRAAPETVRSDVLDGLLSAEEAARHFAVTLDPALAIDAAATARAAL